MSFISVWHPQPLAFARALVRWNEWYDSKIAFLLVCMYYAALAQPGPERPTTGRDGVCCSRRFVPMPALDTWSTISAIGKPIASRESATCWQPCLSGTLGHWCSWQEPLGSYLPCPIGNGLALLPRCVRPTRWRRPIRCPRCV